MALFEIIIVISALYAFCALASLAFDIIKLPWAMFKGDPIDFASTDYLKKQKDWKRALLSAAAFFIGLYGIWTMLPAYGGSEPSTELLDQAYEDGYKYALREYIDCPYCGEGFPEKLSFALPSGDLICPNCIRSDFNDLLNGDVMRCYDCGNFYDSSDSYGVGLCFDCAEHVIVECYNCNHPTFEWPGQDDFAVCPECMGILMEDKSISRPINKWFE